MQKQWIREDILKEVATVRDPMPKPETVEDKPAKQEK